MAEAATQAGPAVRTMPLASIIVGERHRQDMGDLRGLADSIAAHGLLHPVVVSPGNVLIAGQRRLEAIRLLGWAEVPVTVIDVDDLLLAERDENQQRKDFTPSEAVAIGRLIEARHKAKVAELRPKWGRAAVQKRADRNHMVNEQVLDCPEKIGVARDVAASAVGLSGATYHRAKAVVAAAEADPETFGDLPEQMDKTGNVLGAFEEVRRRSTGAPSKRHRIHGRARYPKTDKIMERLVTTMEGLAAEADRLNVGELDTEHKPRWGESLTASLRSLRRIEKELRHG